MGQTESKGYTSEVSFLEKKKPVILKEISNKLIKIIEKNDRERVKRHIYMEFIVDIWYTDIPEDELDMHITEFIRDKYKGWSVLLKIKEKTQTHRRPDIKLSLRRSSINFRSYLFVFKNITFDRKNKHIYPYLYLSDKLNIFKANECVSCWDADPKVVAEPCGHLSLCMQCHADWELKPGSKDTEGNKICSTCQSVVYMYNVNLF